MEPAPRDLTGELASRAQAGDREAFGALVELHWTPLVRLARSVVGDREAEDVVQEALVVAWRRLPSLRRPGAFPAWVRRAVLRRCLRRARRWLPLVSLDTAPEPAADDGAAELRVSSVLSRLAPRQRAVMHLTVIEGCSDAEIGALMGIAAASVRSHRRRARQRLEVLWNTSPSG
jgi:RNA polymerase sigma-70 factor (ECF subfamily)